MARARSTRSALLLGPVQAPTTGGRDEEGGPCDGGGDAGGEIRVSAVDALDAAPRAGAAHARDHLSTACADPLFCAGARRRGHPS